MPESPDISPDGRTSRSRRCSGAIGDIFIVDLETGEIKNVTNDQFGDYAPTFSPDGKSIVYLARVSGNDKLFQLDLATARRRSSPSARTTTAARSSSTTTRWCSPSTATDPNQPIDPEVARNGNIYNIWTLSLKTGELRQYTDALTANVSPVVLRDQKPPRIAFVTLLQGRVRHPHARPARSRCTPSPAPTSARPARSSTSSRRSPTR